MFNDLKKLLFSGEAKMQRGQGIGIVFGGVLLFVMSVILIMNVALPQLNTAIISSSANLTGYAGASGVASSAYVVAILSVLAAAAGLVFLFFRVES